LSTKQKNEKKKKSNFKLVKYVTCVSDKWLYPYTTRLKYISNKYYTKSL